MTPGLPDPEVAAAVTESSQPQGMAVEQTDPAYGDITSGQNPDLWLYRDRTVSLLRRYFRVSIEVGRLPSLLGRELFRTKASAYRVTTFEDAVIFVHDIERILDQLDDFERSLIGKIVLQDYTHDEAAVQLGCWRRTIGRRYTGAIDRLSEMFLESGLLNRLAGHSLEAPEILSRG